MGSPGLAVTRGVSWEGAPDARWLTRPFTLPGSELRFLDTFIENSFITTAASVAQMVRPFSNSPPPGGFTQKAPRLPSAAHPLSPGPPGRLSTSFYFCLSLYGVSGTVALKPYVLFLLRRKVYTFPLLSFMPRIWTRPIWSRINR